MRIYVSGVHGGENPSPGVGIALALRQARPTDELVAVDYSPESTGLHHPAFNNRLVFPAWDQLSIDSWRERLWACLTESDTCWIPGLDLEVSVAARVGLPTTYLAPPIGALNAIDKRDGLTAKRLGLAAPAVLPLPVSGAEIAAFVRRAGGCWVKGHQYDAVYATTAAAVFASLARVEETWGLSGAFLQRHIDGRECSVAFAGRDGKLLGAVAMEKHQRSQLGKTWAGRTGPVPDFLLERIREFVEATGWSGGGEVEMVETFRGQRYLMEVNPRFPGWIHGATGSGVNLPGLLVEGEAVQTPQTPLASRGFVRFVTEMPVDSEIGLAPAGRPTDARRSNDALGANKHPSGMPLLARRAYLPIPELVPAESERLKRVLPAALAQQVLQHVGPTPDIVAHPGLMTDVVERLRSIDWPGGVEIAYSVKTNPAPEYLEMAASLGMLMEAISQDEVAAVEHLVDPSRHVVLNGPAKWWPDRPDAPSVRACFADSIEELQRTSSQPSFWGRSEVHGIRIAPPGSNSRFGIELGQLSAVERVAALLRPILQDGHRLGAHLHLQSSESGPRRWLRAACAAADLALALSALSGAPISMLDIGGGWHPDDLDHLLGRWIPRFLDECRPTLGDANLVLEPGKLLSGGTAAVVSTVLEARVRDAAIDVVLDASIAELPTAPWDPHPVLVVMDGRLVELPPGNDRLLGRTCMESDVLSVAVDARSLRPGDRVAIANAGSYDRSMGFSFGRGRLC